MGQVSLPVLSRKGKHDYWSYNWITTKNYSYNYSEDLFLKKFYFLFFMYSVNYNKNFIDFFFKSRLNKLKNSQNTNYNLINTDITSIVNNINCKNTNKYYMSKIYLCKYNNWVYTYIFVYSITNLRVKVLKKVFKLKYHNYNTLYQSYYQNRHNY